MNHLTGVLEYTNPRTPAVRSNRFEVKSTQKQSKFVARHTATNHWLAVVSQTFLENPFDHFGINRLVPRFDDAMKCIRDDVASDSLCEELEEACVVTYAYLHARFIMQPLGLKAMRRKYESGVFGMCPRFMCEGQNLDRFVQFVGYLFQVCTSFLVVCFVVGKPSGAKYPQISELAEIIQSSFQRFQAAHGKSCQGAMVFVCFLRQRNHPQWIFA